MARTAEDRAQLARTYGGATWSTDPDPEPTGGTARRVSTSRADAVADRSHLPSCEDAGDRARRARIFKDLH
jgi:hypothetical protein